jgi:2'-phosphotransferase
MKNIQNNLSKSSIKQSKRLSYLLRHGAQKEGLEMDAKGFVLIDDLIRKIPDLNIEDLLEIVNRDQKGRFYIIDGMIRANQGHSLDVKVEMELIKDPLDIPTVIHGTFKSNWESIKSFGLTRQHIHFAVGMIGEDGVVSGMRKSCDLFIYINAKKCMEDGIKFYRSANNVILSAGIDGIIDCKYFDCVKDRQGSEFIV